MTTAKDGTLEARYGKREAARRLKAQREAQRNAAIFNLTPEQYATSQTVKDGRIVRDVKGPRAMTTATSTARMRFHMRKGGVMVEHDNRAALEAIRRNDSRFKRARITEVLQAYPSQIAVGVVYELDSKPPRALPDWTEMQQPAS